MVAGTRNVPADGRAEVLEVAGRRAALAAAVAMARAGDVLLVAGKGHETGQEMAGTVHPFDDREVLREVLAEGRTEVVTP
jgi:UDP-N-acetylmuramoyl-L-alanyl-D-glutamate--2,6-diaminopimelate ligase